jgi:hypothetical protein
VTDDLIHKVHVSEALAQRSDLTRYGHTPVDSLDLEHPAAAFTIRQEKDRLVATRRIGTKIEDASVIT